MTNMLTEDSVTLKKKHMYMLTFHRQVVDLPIIGDLACFLVTVHVSSLRPALSPLWIFSVK